jgi:hypothetical protein
MWKVESGGSYTHSFECLRCGEETRLAHLAEAVCHGCHSRNGILSPLGEKEEPKKAD